MRNCLYIFFLFAIVVPVTNAQYYFFGRNKVQYENFDWKIIRTEHFNIYYYGDMEQIAEIGSRYAEEIFDELKVKMNTVISRRIPLIFYNTSNHFQRTNVTPGLIPEGVGGFFEFLKGRVVIPSNGSLTDFRHVIRHELVHVFMTNKIYRTLRDHRLSTDAMPPLWFVEGLAEHWSTEPDAQAEMVMRDALLNNYFFGLEDIWKISGSFLMYKEGQSFLGFIKEKYGYEKVGMILENFWMYKNFIKVIEQTLQTSIKDLNKQWVYSLKQEYYPLYQNKAPQNIDARQLTDFGYNFSPVFFKEGNKNFVYFVANRTGYSSIYRIELDSTYKVLTEPELVIQAEKSDELEAFHLFQSSIDISKDGILSFVIKSGATDVIHLLSVKENKIIKTFKRDYLIFLSSPKYSSDGSKIVFSGIDQKGFSDLFIYHIDQDSLVRLTNDFYDDREPVFNADDSEILFSSNRTAGKYKASYNIFSLNINDYRIKYITYNQFNTYNPIISPDKKNLLLTSDADGVRNIWSINTNGNYYSDDMNKVTRFLTSAFDPRFINDSTLIFSGFEKLSFHLYLLNLHNSFKDSLEQFVMDFSGAEGHWLPKYDGTSSDINKVVYQKEYSLDFATGLVSTDPIFGTRGGAILALSDILGNDKYIFSFYNSATVQSDILRSFNIAIQRINLAKRVNYGYGVFNFAGNRYDIRESDEFFYERSFGATMFLSYPLSRFERIESTVTLMNSNREIVPGITSRKSLLVNNSVAFIHDNSLWGPSGPIDGERWLFLLGYTRDIKFSNINYFSAIADYRTYFRLSYSMALALRMSLYYNKGREARRYFMGGSWDLRGYPLWSIRGEKMWITSLELRFPLIDQLQIKFPIVDLGFFGIRGALFFDAGSAWDKEYKTTYGSIGTGIRFNLFNVIVFRYDIGKKIENNFSDLQKGLFYQFFFGWDF